MDDIQSNTVNSSSFSPVSFQFFGKTAEYWGIWIVNVLLTIVTLGVYSAWAKVRNERYFYGNTELDGHRFSYLATPIQVLKGRIIAVILFGSYYLVSSLFPIVGLVFMLILMGLFPFLICASMRFNMRMSSYRNIRFDFKGKYGDAFVNFILLPILSIFTLYLALPWVLKRIDNFLISNTCYGNKQFKPNLNAGKYYKASFAVFLLSIVIFAIVIFALSLFGLAMPDLNAETAESTQMLAVLPIVFMVLYFLIFTVISAIYTVIIRNHIFESTTLNNVATFSSSFSVLSLAWLNLSNIVAIICSFGLALPWAKIRKAHYVVKRTNVNLSEQKNKVLDEIEGDQNAIGDEVANAFDVDIALT
jgi:uncharacterized membrane protein YjgN (DUF898 family)